MDQKEIHEYVKQFFLENDSTIVEESRGHMHVQLSVEMDKALMNRPFYWHYIEKVGGVPRPMELTFITDKQAVSPNVKGELLHFGSPRLHQIFETAAKMGSHALLYESVHIEKPSQPLRPWLVLNGSVSYICHDKKDQFFSIGLSLLTGEMILNMHDYMEKREFQQKIPNYCFTVTPIIKPISGIGRIKNYLFELEKQKKHPWALDALERMKRDEQILEAFYKDVEEKPETYFKEKEAIKNLYEPSIHISIINGGLFYFFNHPKNNHSLFH